MRTREQLEEKLADEYLDTDYMYTDNGYVVWRSGTGNNLEVLFVEAHPKCGKALYAEFVELITNNGLEPYYSVFCFILGSNTRALKFYQKMGWLLTALGRSVYKHDSTVVASITWDNLVKSVGAKDV